METHPSALGASAGSTGCRTSSWLAARGLDKAALARSPQLRLGRSIAAEQSFQGHSPAALSCFPPPAPSCSAAAFLELQLLNKSLLTKGSVFQQRYFIQCTCSETRLPFCNEVSHTFKITYIPILYRFLFRLRATFSSPSPPPKPGQLPV